MYDIAMYDCAMYSTAAHPPTHSLHPLHRLQVECVQCGRRAAAALEPPRGHLHGVCVCGGGVGGQADRQIERQAELQRETGRQEKGEGVSVYVREKQKPTRVCMLVSEEGAKTVHVGLRDHGLPTTPHHTTSHRPHTHQHTHARNTRP